MNIELISINPHQTHHAAKCIYIYEIIQLEPPPNIDVFCIVYIYICVNICKHKTILNDTMSPKEKQTYIVDFKKISCVCWKIKVVTM